MNERDQISVSELKSAFLLYEEWLSDKENQSVAKSVIDDTRRRIEWENSLRKLLASALSEVFSDYEVKESNRGPDISIAHNGRTVGAIECKGTVSNSHRGDGFRNSLDVWGIRTKLYPDARSKNSVLTDIQDISTKIDSPHSRWEIFVPIVYEIYRRGATQSELFEEKRHWTTHPNYRMVRETLTEDAMGWFERKFPGEFVLLHACEPVRLLDAREIWTELCEGKATCTPVSEAYVNFSAIGRYV